MELKIANAQVIVNYAAFLEENKYFEESFKVGCEGIEYITALTADLRARHRVVQFPDRFRNLEHLPVQVRQAIRRQEAGTYARSVRASAGKLPGEVLQASLPHVRQAGRGARSCEARYGYLRPCCVDSPGLGQVRDVHDLHCEGDGQLWLAGHTTDLRAGTGVVAGQGDGGDVSSFRTDGAQAGRDRPSSGYLRPRQSILRPEDYARVLERVERLRE